jgi:hypothetical protein
MSKYIYYDLVNPDILPKLAKIPEKYMLINTTRTRPYKKIKIKVALIDRKPRKKSFCQHPRNPKKE